ncbi:hypothetical protein ACFVZ3_12220 [Kitasatospora purpeofusca]|uniref:hypothetical protein n=1 Tax=Kitasatospora purpeofusca TaxID=67352 RepID=UPI0036A1586C
MAKTLAPLVARWLERGCTSADLARALLPGLLTPVHSTPAALRSRLERKLPPAPVPSCPATARCAECHDPVPRAGTCRSCTGFPVRTAAVGAGGTVTCGWVSRARDALRAARSVGPGFGSLLPTG